MTTSIDELDRALIAAMRKKPRASVTQLAGLVGVARGTVYSRLDRLEADGVITGFGPEVEPAAAGYGVLAFCTLEIAQGSHAKTTKALAKMAEVIEIHTITGAGDLLLRIIARSNDHLHEVLQSITAIPTVGRSETQLALSSQTCRSVADVVANLRK